MFSYFGESWGIYLSSYIDSPFKFFACLINYEKDLKNDEAVFKKWNQQFFN